MVGGYSLCYPEDVCGNASELSFEILSFHLEFSVCLVLR